MTEDSITSESLRVRVLAHLGQTQAAYAEAHALAGDAPGNPRVAIAFADAALAAGQPGVAIEALERLVQASPREVEAHYMLGLGRLAQQEAEPAEAAFVRAVELSPEHVRAAAALGDLRVRRGDYEGALRAFDGLASAAGYVDGLSATARARAGRAEALLALGRLDDANAELGGLHVDERDHPLVRGVTGRLRLGEQRADEAVELVRPLAARPEADASDHALLGDALGALGRQTEALASYERALALDGELPHALLGKANLSLSLGKTRDAEAALVAAEAAVQRRIHAPRVEARRLILRARLDLRDGRAGRRRALEALRQAVELPLAPAEAYFFLGETLMGEQPTEGRDTLRHYLEVAPNGPLAARARRLLGDS